MDVATGKAGGPARPARRPPGRAASPACASRRRASKDEIAFTVNSAQSPGDVYTLDLHGGKMPSSGRGRSVDGIDTTPFREAEIVEWKSFDGLEISGLINRAPARFTGKRPVLINIHGGPEGQASIGFLGRNNYFIDELGIASHPAQRARLERLRQDLHRARQRHEARGFGQGHRRAARLGRDATRPRREPHHGHRRQLRRLHEPGRRDDLLGPHRGVDRRGRHLELHELPASAPRPIAATCVAWNTATSAIPAMRAFFEKISPLSKAANIRKPLFVVQGLNDPRVPYQEADQIVAKARGERHPGLVPAGRQRRPRLRAKAERGLPVLRPGALHAAVPAALDCRQR